MSIYQFIYITLKEGNQDIVHTQTPQGEKIGLSAPTQLGRSSLACQGLTAKPGLHMLLQPAFAVRPWHLNDLWRQGPKQLMSYTHFILIYLHIYLSTLKISLWL